jgi:hypothetical protein
MSSRPGSPADGEVVLLFGSEAISTFEHYAGAGKADRPDFAEHADGSLEDRGYGLRGLVSRHLAAHGLTGAPGRRPGGAGTPWRSRASRRMSSPSSTCTPVSRHRYSTSATGSASTPATRAVSR